MKSASFANSWLLPVLISLFPLLICVWNLEDDRERVRQEQKTAFWESTDGLVRLLRQVTRPEFWPGEWTRRLCKDLGADGQGPLSREKVGKHLTDWKGTVASESLVWVAAGALGSQPVTLVEEGGTGFRFVWTNLFKFLFVNHQDPENTTMSREDRGRLRSLFGEYFPPNLLGSEQRGRAFPVIFKGTFYLMCWDLIFGETVDPQGKKVRILKGGVVALFPQARLKIHDVKRLVLSEWGRLSHARQQTECAFIPLPVQPGPFVEPVFGSLRWLKGEVREKVYELVRSQYLAPPKDEYIADGPQLVGNRVLDVLDFATHWGRVVPVAPVMGCGAVLCQKKQPVRVPFRESLARGLLAVWLLSWVMILVFRWWFGFLPDPGIRTGLGLWFLALLAVPMTLMLQMATTWLSDFRENRLWEKRLEMEQTVRQIEAGTTALNEEQAQFLKRYGENPTLGERLLAVERGSLASETFMDQVYEDFLHGGPEPGAVFFHGHGSFEVARFRRAALKEQEAELGKFVRSLSDGILNLAAPDLAREYEERAEKEGKRAVKMFNPFQGLASNPQTLFQAGTLRDFRMGRVKLMKYHSIIKVLGKARFCMIIFWGFDRNCRRFLETRIPQMNIANPDLNIAAYKILHDDLEPVFVPRGSSELTRWAQQARERPIFLEHDQRLILAVPSQTLPDYLLVVQAPLDRLHEALRAEEQRLIALALALALLVALSGYGLSTWLSLPVTRMTAAIERIAGGNLDILVAESRPDELGDAGASIDEMTRQLQERRRMSRFVAPQVLELTASGALNTTMGANVQKAVVLVCDIREFTTISETHPPEEVFSSLNQHIQVMARAIRTQGGVIDRFIGDAVQAFFYPASDRENPARRAIQAAADMMRGHHLLSVHRQRKGRFPYRIGIGLDAGEVVTGVVGDPARRLDFMVLGDVVKHAAELEALSKQGTRTFIICSAGVRAESGFEDLLKPLSGQTDVFELQEFPAESVSEKVRHPADAILENVLS